MDGAVCFFDIFSCFIIPSQMIVFGNWTAEQTAAWPVGCPTAAPRESHPPSIPLGPTHCLRRSERSDYGDRGVPDLLCVVAHALPGAFCGAGGYRSLHRRSQRTRRPARHRRDVFVCLYTAPKFPAGLSFLPDHRRVNGGQGKGGNLAPFT